MLAAEPNFDQPEVARPRRRWLQFSLRTLFIVMTIAAVALCWWNHRGHCLRKAESHEFLALMCHISENIVVTWEDDGSTLPIDHDEIDERARDHRLAQHHEKLSDAYRQAIYQPWVRLWIDEKPLSDAVHEEE